MKTKILKITIIFLCLTVSFSACNKQEHVDSKINIEMEEIINENLSTLQFNCSTEKAIYPSCSYYIKYEYNKTSNNINITFKEVVEPEIGVALPGFAHAYINLGILDNGTYLLTLNNGRTKRKGELIVSSDSYKINFKNNNKFKFKNKSLIKNKPI